MSVVVSDTSPLRALEWLGLFDVFEPLYGRALVSPAVVLELQRVTERFRQVDFINSCLDQTGLDLQATSVVTEVPTVSRFQRSSRCRPNIDPCRFRW